MKQSEAVAELQRSYPEWEIWIEREFPQAPWVVVARRGEVRSRNTIWLEANGRTCKQAFNRADALLFDICDTLDRSEHWGGGKSNA